MKIKLQIRYVYGKERIYPINDLAKSLAEFKGDKTFNREDIKALKAIGFKPEWMLMDIPEDLL